MLRSLPITACVLTLNEEDRIVSTLEAIRQRVERILVLDAGSSDHTAELARRLGAEVLVRGWCGYVNARQYLLGRVNTPWVLMIDADEILQSDFWQELEDLGFPDSSCDAFQMRRRTVYIGHTMRRAWQPDWKTVLFRRCKAEIVGGNVHESIRVGGQTRRLRAELSHLGYRSLSEHYRQILRYAELAANDLEDRDTVPSWIDLVLRPLWSWLSHLIFRGAVLDGKRGLLTAHSAALSTFLRYALLFESKVQTEHRTPLGEISPAVQDPQEEPERPSTHPGSAEP